MAQPSFSPVPIAGEVRPTMSTPGPEFGRAKKSGLFRSATHVPGPNEGTNAPGEGFALTLATRECHKLTFAHHEDLHDVVAGVAAVAAKRASLIGRGPTLGDVHVAMDAFDLRAASPVSRETTKPFIGLAHSYVALRRFVDGVPGSQLTSA